MVWACIDSGLIMRRIIPLIPDQRDMIAGVAKDAITLYQLIRYAAKFRTVMNVAWVNIMKERDMEIQSA